MEYELLQDIEACFDMFGLEEAITLILSDPDKKVLEYVGDYDLSNLDERPKHFSKEYI